MLYRHSLSQPSQCSCHSRRNAAILPRCRVAQARHREPLSCREALEGTLADRSSPKHLWALVSNGLSLLILRDSASITRQAYIEYDLEDIFENETFADFRLLWMVCHQSRLEGTTKDRPETCWLEVWSKKAEAEGRRALDQLRVGIQKALESLGTGFVAQKANQKLRDRLQAGQLHKQDLYRQRLRLVYRLIFLFVAEDRDLLHFLAIYRRAGVLWRENDPQGNPLSLRFLRMFDMVNDSGLFVTQAKLVAEGHKLSGGRYIGPRGVLVPLLEAKMLYHYNHRFGDFALLQPGEREHILPQASETQLGDPQYLNSPRYWVNKVEVASRTPRNWSAEWFLGWRDVTDPRSSVRTVVPCLIPNTGVSGKFPLYISDRADLWTFYANLSSFPLDYCGRQKLGGVPLSLFIMKQLPVLPPSTYDESAPWCDGVNMQDWLRERVLELTYTAWDLRPFAQDCGWSGPPFRWGEERRFLLRCELDAAFFHLYLPAEANGGWRPAENETIEDQAQLKASFPTPRDAVAYIMETFPIVKRKEEAKWKGDFRTKRIILETYDAMAEAIRTGIPYPAWQLEGI